MSQENVLHFVVGDIHGCYSEFLELEDDIATYCEKQKSTPFIISVGDLLDRGPNSKEIVRYFFEKTKEGKAAVVAGNHEAVFFDILTEFAPQVLNAAGIAQKDHLPAFAQGLKNIHKFGGFVDEPIFKPFADRLMISWLRQGGMATLTSFGCESLDPSTWKMDPELISFLHKLPMLWENSKAIVTHALATFRDLNFAREVEADDLDFPRDCEEYFTRLDGIIWNRKQPLMRVDPMRLHVSGHTPANDPVYYKEQASLIVDTGCCFGNALTAWCIENEEFLAVKAGS